MVAISTEAKIIEALNTQLAALALTPALPIAWTNYAFTPPFDDVAKKPKPYLRATFLKNPNIRRSTNPSSLHRMSGLFQVDVFYPIGTGEIAAREVAAAVIAQFPIGSKLGDDSLTVRIDERPTDGPSLIDGALLQIPVTIRWLAFA